MRQRLSTAGLLLLVIAMVMGLAGCTKEAPTRTPAVPQAQKTQTGVPPSGLTAAPGETVVSVFTALPPGPGTPTAELVGETPAVSTPVATMAPGETAAPAPTPVPAPPSGQVIVHVVQPGETLYSIAYRYGTTVQAIIDANGIANPDQIYQGQKLNVPTSSGGSSGGSAGCRIRHTVKTGEWVWQIARNYGVDPYDILAANGMTVQTANTIYPGLVLCIP